MNFNKDYPIAILDTNIAISVPNILNILKGCNIVIPYTLIDELDKLKKEKKGARHFVNNLLAISENANLSKDGYKLENDCMLYVDRYNLSHKDVKLDSTAKKEDIKFIAVQKNLKEKYNDMEVVLISFDKIMKIKASTFDVKVKFLEEFIMEYLKDEFKLDVLFDLLEEYIESKDEENYDKLHEIIFKILSDSKDINGLYKLADNSYVVTKYGWNNIKGLENVDKYKKACQKMLEFLYNKIFEILSENKDIDGLYKLAENEDPDKTITVITDENKHIEVNFREEIYSEILEILSENKDIDGLYELAEIYKSEEVYKKIFEILSENKDIDGLFKLYEIYKSEEVYKRIFEILSENKDIKRLYEFFIKDGKIEYYEYLFEYKYFSNNEIKNRMNMYEKMFEILIDKIEELENKK